MIPPVLVAASAAPSLLLAAEGRALGTMEWIFLGLWVFMGLLYWANYRQNESLPGSVLKVGGLLLFVYSVMKGFDWLAQTVPADQVITFGIGEAPVGPGERVPLLADALWWFVVAMVVLVIWHARRKIGTVFAVVLSAWDRGHWYILPVIFILVTVGLLLVAAAASPVLSPFIYTLF
jgi:hypothetical protein